MGVTELETEPISSGACSARPVSASQTPATTWTDVVVLHAPSVRRHALRLTGNQHDADDLTQDVLLRALSTPAISRPGTTAGWLYRITTNLFIDSCRHRKRRPQGLLADNGCESLMGGAPDPADILDARWLSGDVQAALEHLPIGHRSAVILRDIEALSYAEIAERLGVGLNTVRSHIHRGREQLRTALASRQPPRVTQVRDRTSPAAEA